MNGENNQVFRTLAPDSVPLDRARPRYTWALFALQLWLLAAFVGMSLFAIAAKLVLTSPSEAQPAAALALGLLGAVLAPVAWWNLAYELGRAERESGDAQPAPTPSSDRVVPAKQVLLATDR